MPTYEYECRACGKHFDLYQGIKDEPAKKCPECGGKVKRLLGSGAAVIVKSGASRERFSCGRDSPCRGSDSPCLREHPHHG